MRRLYQLLLVGIGGAVGALCRWGLLDSFGDTGQFPWATFAANVVGCAALGAITAGSANDRTRWLLGTGFCGGLTTMSTFAVEVVALLDDGAVLGAIYFVSSVLVGLGAFVLGRTVMGGST